MITAALAKQVQAVGKPISAVARLDVGDNRLERASDGLVRGQCLRHGITELGGDDHAPDLRWVLAVEVHLAFHDGIGLDDQLGESLGRSVDRRWAALRPLVLQLLGKSRDLAERRVTLAASLLLFGLLLFGALAGFLVIVLLLGIGLQLRNERLNMLSLVLGQLNETITDQDSRHVVFSSILVVPDTKTRSASGCGDDGQMIPAYRCLGGVIDFAVRRLAATPSQIAAVADRKLTDAVLLVSLDGCCILDDQRHPDAFAVTRDILAGVADRILFPVAGIDHLWRMVERDRQRRHAPHGAAIKHFLWRAIDAHNLFVWDAKLVP